MEKTIGRRLRSEAVINGRTLKEGHMEFARPGRAARKEKLGETPDQKVPANWGKKAVLPDPWGPEMFEQKFAGK
jgi:hydroxymethylglutaryl-CoA lyase